MNQIEHIIEPKRLWLVWRPPISAAVRSRRTVAEIVADTEGAGVKLRYLYETPDFIKAKEEGFTGYPAFDCSQQQHSEGVLGSFMRRLPPRKRDDFANYLRQHRLPTSAVISDMALLGYTNAKLPGDSFELYLDLTNAVPPLEIIMEVAGFRHQGSTSTEGLYTGDPIVFKAEPDNLHDHEAIMVFHSGRKIGYVPRSTAPAMLTWMRKGRSLNACIERINGKPERPLVYLYVAVR